MHKVLYYLILMLFLPSALFAATIAYWDFNDTLTSSVNPNQTGAIIGSVGYTTDKAPNSPGAKSLYFSGGYVTMNNTTSILTGLSNFTIEAFFNPSTTNQIGTIYSEDGVNRSAYLGYFGSSGYMRFFIGQGSIQPLVSNCEVLDVPISIVANTWHHVAATFNGTTKTISLYLDGVLIGSRSVSISTVPISNENPTIGGWSYTNGEYAFAGAIDQVRLSDQALATTQFLGTVPEPTSIIFFTLGLGLLFLRKKTILRS